MTDHSSHVTTLDQPPAIAEALACWQQWDWPLTSKPEILHPLNSGSSHHSFLIISDLQKMVLRLESQRNRELAINKENEVFWHQSVGELAPNVVWHNQQVLVTEFIELPHWQPSQNLAPLGNTLAQLHELNIPCPTFNLLQHMQDYWQQGQQLQNLQSQNQKSQNQQGLHQRMMAYTQQLLEKYPQKAPCHNDLNPTNILMDKQRCVFIDWEYACENHPAFDLATLIEFGDLTQSQFDELLAAYHCNLAAHPCPSFNPQPLAVIRQQAMAFRPVVRYLQWLWLNLQADIPQTELQFALQRLKQLI